MVMSKAEQKKNPESEPRIFISYSNHDSDAANILREQLAKHFEQTDTNIFRDDPDTKPGKKIGERK
jgi:hypothetical protein